MKLPILIAITSAVQISSEVGLENTCENQNKCEVKSEFGNHWGGCCFSRKPPTCVEDKEFGYWEYYYFYDYWYYNGEPKYYTGRDKYIEGLISFLECGMKVDCTMRMNINAIVTFFS